MTLPLNVGETRLLCGLEAQQALGAAFAISAMRALISCMPTNAGSSSATAVTRQPTSARASAISARTGASSSTSSTTPSP